MKTRTVGVHVTEVENGYCITRTETEYDGKGNARAQTSINYVASNTATLFGILNDCFDVQAN